MLRRFAPILAPLAVLCAYVRVLGAPFAWDDRHLIVGSPVVTTLQPIASYFGSAFWQSPETGDLRGYYRPLTILSFAIDHAIHGENPAAFHLTNLVIHATNVTLLYFLMRKYRVAPNVALVLATLWGLLPRLTEACAWVSGRTDLLATLFVLLGLLAHRAHRIERVVLASSFVTIGLFAKEIALAGVAAIVAIEMARAGCSIARRALHALVPLGLAAAFVVLRQSIIGGDVQHESLQDLSLATHVMLPFATIGEYARMLVWPWKPELQIGVARTPSAGMAVVGTVVSLALAAWIVRERHLWLVRRKNVQSLVVVGSALVAGLALVLHVAPLAVNVVAADRFLYLPSAGIALAIAPCVEMWRAHRAKIALSAALVLSFGVATFARVGTWCNELDLWSVAYAEAPHENAVPLNELGNVYFRAGLFEDAARIYSRISVSRISRANYASALDELGDYDHAAPVLAALCHDYDWNADNCLAAALVDLHRLRFDEARAHAHTALGRLHGDYPAASRLLARIDRVETTSKSAQFLAASTSADALARDTATFELAVDCGRRLDALRAAESLLRTPGAPRPLRREAAEFWARFGPPDELSRVLENPGASDVVDATMLDAIHERARVGGELSARWPSLGFGG